MQNTRINRLKTILAVLLLLSTLGSELSLTRITHHHCTGENCKICLIIQIAEQNLKLLKLAIATLFLISQIYSIHQTAATLCTVQSYRIKTLISEKIRLNN